MLKTVLLAAGGVLMLLAGAAIYTQWQAARIAARFPPQSVFVTVEGVTIHFSDLKPEGEPAANIVLIHGASGNEREMRAALGDRLLRKGYRVISVDRPGLGWSTRKGGADENDPAAQARLIRKAIEKHGVKQSIAVVHSLAGALGLQLALDHADVVKGVMLIAPATHPWPGGIALYYRIAASPAGPLFNYTFALPAGQAAMPAALESVFAPQEPPPDYRARTGVELVLRPASFAANAQDVAGLYDFVSREWPRYRNIRIPVAIVSGDADKIVYTSIHSRNSAREIPGATLNVLPGVGHCPHWTHPEAVLQAIDEVVARTRDRRDHDNITAR
ncbi:MAG: alpha/beta fold hydrolase [Beijerinckiaceae bacterium]